MRGPMMTTVAAVLALLAGSGPALADRSLDAVALRASQAAIGRQVGDLQLSDQFGRPFRLAELAGRPLVLSLVYTHCYDVCSGLTLHLREAVRIAHETLGDARFSVLTVGFDVERDTTASMLAYGIDRGIDDPAWRFASADAATIARLADAVGFTWRATPTGFQHVTQVTVVDADGIVVQQVYGQDFQPPELVEPLKSLVLARGFDRSTVSGVLDSVRLFCTAYDPVSGRYVFDYSMIVAAMPALLLLGMVAAAIIIAGRGNR